MPTPQLTRRTWGTRFDSLVEPTLSKAAVTNPDIGLHSPPYLRDTAASASVNDHDPDSDATPALAEKERPNPAHDHKYPRSMSSGAPPSIDTSSPAQARMPHDASVFIASLPSHVPETELHVQLSDHLSKHATIKHIKLIRDNRGAVCAFVQVESAAQASDLISACNLSQFMDRHIRCEIARAFRTLLVSWRPAGQANGINGDGSRDVPQSDNAEKTGKALRLRRCRGTKYIQVVHGTDALSSDLTQLPNFSSPRLDDLLSGSGIFFPEGIKEGDFESLKSLLSAFGALEFITPFEQNSQPQGPGPAHFTSKSQSRDEGAFIRGGADIEGGDALKEGGEPERSHPQMWAAKWEHRNDAVSAITALQYVPNLFVCWSHTYGRPHYAPCTPSQSHGQTQSPYTSNYAHSRASSGIYTQASYPATPYTPGYPRTDPSAPDTPSLPHHNADEAAGGGAEAQWAGARLQQLHAQVLASPGVIDPTKGHQVAREPITFSESDFPPLGGAPGGVRGRGKRGAWMGRRNFVRAGAPSPPPISTTLSPSHLRAGSDTTSSAIPHTPDLDSAIEPSPVTPAFLITPRTPSGGYAPSDEMRPGKDEIYASGLGPGFGAQSFAPRHAYEDGPGVGKAPDGRELFVGGLEVDMWDEERLGGVFRRYGMVEEVRYVRPGYHAPPHRRAFAFVKFADQEAPQKAIKEEHLRVYEDSKIKVQLRSANPPKRWGVYRGRGRFHHGIVRASRDFERDGSMGEMPAVAVEEYHTAEPPEGDRDDVSEETGHVRFASAPEVMSTREEDVVEQKPELGSAQRSDSEAFEDAAECDPVLEESTHGPGAIEEPLEGREARFAEADSFDSSMSLSDSDGVADASMEVQTRFVDTTVTLADADVTASLPSPPADSTEHELQSEMESLTVVSATPPPSNPDATSTYAPSSSSTGSAPTSTGYYPQTPSWIPPYAVPSNPYGPYGYYPQQVPGQAGVDGSNTYPPAWMATLYRNVVPFVPWFNPPPGVELAPPPVKPTGYIQREPGGIFIPVYPPERLGQYMSTSGTGIDQSQPQSQPQAATSSIGNWQNLPPHPQLYPVPFPQTMMMPQQAPGQHQPQQHQHHLPMTGNGWITGPLPGSAYPAQHAPSSAPPPYPAPNGYFPPPSSATPTHVRQSPRGPYDPAVHHPPAKHSNRRGADYSHQQHRNFGPRDGRSSQRRGPGGSTANAGGEHSFAAAADPQFAYGQVKPNSALPAQLAIPPSTSGSEWNWNAQNR